MTTSIKQTWAAIVPDRAKADAPRQQGKNGETGFADAVKSVRTGKRDAHVGHEAGHKPSLRLHVALELPDRVAGEVVAANTRHHEAGGRDTDGAEVSMNETPEEPTPSDQPAAAASATPSAFRPLLPPMILLGGLGRHEAGSPSGDGISKAPADAAPALAEPGKTGAQPAKAAVTATPVLSAAAIVTPAQANAKTATREAAPLSQSSASQAASTVGKNDEPKPTQIPADPAVKPAAGSPGTDTAAKAEATAKPAAAGLDSVVARTAKRTNSPVEGAADVAGPSGRVIVVAQQNIPAPTAPAPGLTAAPLLAAVAADGSWREVAAASHLRDLSAQSAVAPAHSLKVQLRPAELGMVTASLRLSGDQLTIELQVESVEAQQRLSADSDTIVKSLRALGLEVDRVTIQQSTVVQTSNGRADANAGQNGQPAPDRQSFSAGSSGGGNGQGGGQQPGRSTSNGAHVSQNSASPGPDRAGGGLYI
jgi:chemotaxis protein MotD